MLVGKELEPRARVGVDVGQDSVGEGVAHACALCPGDQAFDFFVFGENLVVSVEVESVNDVLVGDFIVRVEFCGLDCYNDSVFTDVCIAVTTRINACSHYWLMFVYED